MKQNWKIGMSVLAVALLIMFSAAAINAQTASSAPQTTPTVSAAVTEPAPNLVITPGATPGTVVLNWSTSGLAGTVKSYAIQRADFTKGRKQFKAKAGITTMTMTGLVSNEMSYYRIMVQTSAGKSPYSAVQGIMVP